MSRVLVFDAYVPGDAALENSHWVAERTAEVLNDVTVLTGREAVRDALERALQDDAIRAVVLCGHGDGGRAAFLLRNQHHERDLAATMKLQEISEHGAVYGADGETALDDRSVACTAGRWVHAIACEVGIAPLPARAVDAGAVAFAAYEQSLTPEFDRSALPPDAASLLATVATSTTLRMAGGTYDEEALQGAARLASEAIDAWMDSDAARAWIDSTGWIEQAGLRKFAKQFSSALRVFVREPGGPA